MLNILFGMQLFELYALFVLQWRGGININLGKHLGSIEANIEL